MFCYMASHYGRTNAGSLFLNVLFSGLLHWFDDVLQLIYVISVSGIMARRALYLSAGGELLVPWTLSSVRQRQGLFGCGTLGVKSSSAGAAFVAAE